VRLLREAREGGGVSDILDAGMDSNVVPITDQWVKFLVRDIDPVALGWFQMEAVNEQLSVSEVMRQKLCAFFNLDCVPSRASARSDSGSTTRLLRLQPELFEAIKLRARTEGLSMQVVVKAALGA